MNLKVVLITSLFVGAALTFPQHYNSELNSDGKDKMTEALSNENLLELKNNESSTISAKEKEQNDLVRQETFYPLGGVWWGVRPWGGWGGWNGWGGFRPWHGPHWGGHWMGYRPWHGPHWGGHWGNNWGRTSS